MQMVLSLPAISPFTCLPDSIKDGNITAFRRPFVGSPTQQFGYLIRLVQWEQTHHPRTGTSGVIGVSVCDKTGNDGDITIADSISREGRNERGNR